MNNNVSIYGIPFYMVESRVHGYYLYKSLEEAATAIETWSTPDDTDEGRIFVMTTGPSYEDATTVEIFSYRKNGSTMFQCAYNFEEFSYEALVEPLLVGVVSLGHFVAPHIAEKFGE